MKDKTRIDKIKIIIYEILTFIFAILTYILCDYIKNKTNLLVGLTIAMSIYMIIVIILKKIFKIKY